VRIPSAASDSPAPGCLPREGWDEAFAAAVKATDEELLLDFPNEFDEKEWRW
jgi:hypothetical protein